jgi:hypothetical protein
VRLHRLGAVALALAEDQDGGDGGDACVYMDRQAAREVEHVQADGGLVGIRAEGAEPAVGREHPVRHRDIHE